MPVRLTFCEMDVKKKSQFWLFFGEEPELYQLHQNSKNLSIM